MYSWRRQTGKEKRGPPYRSVRVVRFWNWGIVFPRLLSSSIFPQYNEQHMNPKSTRSGCYTFLGIPSLIYEIRSLKIYIWIKNDDIGILLQFTYWPPTFRQRQTWGGRGSNNSNLPMRLWYRLLRALLNEHRQRILLIYVGRVAWTCPPMGRGQREARTGGTRCLSFANQPLFLLALETKFFRFMVKFLLTHIYLVSQSVSAWWEERK